MSAHTKSVSEACVLLLVLCAVRALGQGAPIISSTAATNIGYSSADFISFVNPNGFEAKVFFEYGSNTNYGTATDPVIISATTNSVPVAISISGLLAGLTYQFRAVASNSSGVLLGTNVSFTTLLFSNLYGAPFRCRW